MTASEAREQVGKFEFTVVISGKTPDGERRVNVLANWLLAEWERAQSLAAEIGLVINTATSAKPPHEADVEPRHA